MKRREIRSVGFLGISDYGLGQLEVLTRRYKVAFATAKKTSAVHAVGLEGQLRTHCEAAGVEYLGAVDANDQEVVERAAKLDLLIIGGYDAILKEPILKAPKHGVLNTHLGYLPQNRGCCPTMWAQLHGLPQGYTTYLVGTAIDHGGILDRYEAPCELGVLRDNNRHVYDALARTAVERFDASLERYECGEPLQVCEGPEAYHRKGIPNDAWLSFQWSDTFLCRFSLALDFRPYLPGRAQVLGEGTDGDAVISLAVNASERVPDDAMSAVVGQVLEVLQEAGDDGCQVLVRTREGAVRCSLRKGTPPAAGAILGPPIGDNAAGTGSHAIPSSFAGDVLPLDPYICQGGEFLKRRRTGS